MKLSNHKFWRQTLFLIEELQMTWNEFGGRQIDFTKLKDDMYTVCVGRVVDYLVVGGTSFYTKRKHVSFGRKKHNCNEFHFMFTKWIINRTSISNTIGHTTEANTHETHAITQKTILLNHWLHMFYYWMPLFAMFSLVSLKFCYRCDHDITTVPRNGQFCEINSRRVINFIYEYHVNRFDSDNGDLKWQVDRFCGTFCSVHWTLSV